jgi:diguanylate cyclase (GGDEF)-like protein/PAS domain S-box-containing protein
MQIANISNELLFEIHEKAPAIMAFHDPQQRIVWANEAYRHALGVPLVELGGQACHHLWGLSAPCLDCPVTQALATGEPAEGELTPSTQDGWPENQGVWLVKAVPIRDQDGQIVGAVETAFEITERKKAEQKRLEESEQRYRAIFEQAGDGILLLDRYGSIKDCNPACSSMLGYPRDELLQADFTVFIPSESLAGQPFPEKVVAGGEHARIERELLCKNGSRRTMEESLVELHTGDLLLMLRDITDRKQMERELTKERRLLRTIIDTIPVMITHYDPDSNMLYLNKEFERIVGWSTEEARHIDLMKQVYPDPEYRGRVWEYMQKAASEWREFRVHSKHGEIIDSQWSNILLEDGTRVGIGIDIRERKRAEEELRQSRNLLAEAERMADVGAWSWDIEKDVWSFSDNWLRIHGCHEPPRSIDDLLQIAQPDDLPRIREAVSKSLTERTRYDIEHGIVRRDNGVVRHVWSFGEVIVNEAGEATRMFGASMDVTRRKRNEQALNESLRQLATLMGNLPGMAYRCRNDPRWTMLFISEGCYELTGYSRKDLVQNRRASYADLILEEDRNRICEEVQKGLHHNGRFEVEYRITTAEGREKHVLERGTGVYDGKLLLFLEGFVADITEQKAIEAALKQRNIALENAEKLAGLASWELNLADSVLHVSNNWLAIHGSSNPHPTTEELRPMLHPNDIPAIESAFARTLETGEPYSLEHRIIRQDNGETRWVKAYAQEKRTRADQPRTLYGATLDITELVQERQALAKSEKRLQALIEASSEAIYFMNADWSEMRLLHGGDFIPDTLEPNPDWLNEYVYPEDQQYVLEGIREAIRTEGAFELQHRVIRIDGTMGWTYSRAVPVHNDAAEIVEWFGAATDITDRKQMEEQLRQLSLYDSLTGLYNRTFFDLEKERFAAKRFVPMGVVVCDLDGLKFVNDTLGHSSGDDMIANAATILRQCFRSSEIIARIGGDEFAILLPEIDEKGMHGLIGRLRKEVEHFNAGKPGIPVSLSIGYAVGRNGDTDLEALFREADNRMYREKIQKEQSPRNEIVQGLIKAVEARDFLTEGHSERLQDLVASMARALDLSEDRIRDLCLFARFHDLGKVGIHDHILFKPESLTHDEFQEMQKHSEVGQRIAQSIHGMALVADWILKHHERWDGLGYPFGLQGRDIPLECRILAIADAFDVMTSDRPYQKAVSFSEAVQELRCCAGTQFDPDLVERFIQILECEYNA